MFIDAAGHKIVATHGDLDSVGGTSKTISVLLHKRFGVDVECIIIGDKHHPEYLEELDICSYMCGSLCGADDYANKKRLYTSPSQLLLIVNQDDAIDAEYKLHCSV